MTSGFRFKKAELGKFKSASTAHIQSMLKNGCRIMGLTMGNFSLIDLIHCILKFTGPGNVTCVTWSAGIKDAHNVAWMKDS